MRLALMVAARASAAALAPPPVGAAVMRGWLGAARPRREPRRLRQQLRQCRRRQKLQLQLPKFH